MKRIFFLLLVGFISTLNETKCQIIELEQALVDCNKIEINNIVHYEPYAVSFIFRVKNETQDTLIIGAYNAPARKEPIKFGYFEVKFKNGEIFKLESIDGSRFLPPNYDMSLVGDLVENKLEYNFIKQFNSYTEIRNSIVNCKMSFTCMKETYNCENENCHFFPTQKIIMRDYLITFNSRGQIIHFYHIGEENYNN